MPVYLDPLANTFARRAVEAIELFDESHNVHERAYLVIRLYSDWESFSKRLLYVSALCKPINASGARIGRASCGARTGRDIDAFLKHKLKRPLNRPLMHAWGTPPQMIKACKHVGPANLSTLQAAISLSNSRADELRLVRNFIAHRSGEAALNLPSGAPVNVTVLSITDWLARRPILGGSSRFSDWATSLMDVARAAIQ